MVSLSQVEENMEIHFKKKHQGAAFHVLCRIYPALFMEVRHGQLLTKAMEEKRDGCYTKMLRMVFNVSWQDKLTNKELYGNLPPASSKVGFRRLKLAGHCVRHPEEEASKLLLWQPMSECMNMGRSSVTYIDILKSDTSLESAEELRTPMLDRETWKRRAKSRRALARP